jgi:hypothetical protein
MMEQARVDSPGPNDMSVEDEYVDEELKTRHKDSMLKLLKASGLS